MPQRMNHCFEDIFRFAPFGVPELGPPNCCPLAARYPFKGGFLWEIPC